MVSRIVCNKRNLSVLHRSLQRQHHRAAALHLLLAQLCDFAVESSSRLKFVSGVFGWGLLYKSTLWWPLLLLSQFGVVFRNFFLL
jgi:hypothetical protein